MAKLYDITTNRKKRSRITKGRRFYVSLDMSIIKHDDAIKNSRIKRGEEKSRPNNDIVICGCGATGCFVHVGWENPKQHNWGKGPAEDTHNSGNPEK